MKKEAHFALKTLKLFKPIFFLSDGLSNFEQKNFKNVQKQFLFESYHNRIIEGNYGGHKPSAKTLLGRNGRLGSCKQRACLTLRTSTHVRY